MGSHCVDFQYSVIYQMQRRGCGAIDANRQRPTATKFLGEFEVSSIFIYLQFVRQ